MQDAAIMLFPSRRSGVVAALVLLVSSLTSKTFVNASSTSTAPTAPMTTTAVQGTGTCEARTINYITDSLPQQCLRKEWNGFNGTGLASGSLNVTVGQENTTTTSADVMAISSPSSTAPEIAEASAMDLESGELGEASFLSFEEWKKQTLEKVGQVNTNIGTKKSADGKKRDTESFQNNLASLGDDGEIDLDFSSFRSGGKGEGADKTAGNGDAEVKDLQEEESSKKKDHYRSKDAGKTCKERFSYASFDAGATILKTHPGAKNSKAVLIENKDSYMLSECSVENKFIIIELSEDIWIDTVVLANYEFFSSQIRTFRVSLSDRYPVKIDKWKDVGTYEARNSREIQAFLISNPQIWARYIRIEFLSHYGNEYYCPLSLVRVHGTRMLESWKETEANNEDEEAEEEEDDEAFVPDAVADVVQEEEKLRAAAGEMLRIAMEEKSVTECDKNISEAPLGRNTTPWIKAHIFEVVGPTWLDDMCLPGEAPQVIPDVVSIESATASFTSTTSTSQVSSTISAPIIESQKLNTTTASTSSPAKTEHVVATSNIAKDTPSSVSVPSNSSSQSTPVPSTSTPPASKSQNLSTVHKDKTSATSSASSALPTIQESFFKAVSRRLNFLETNSTLSLKYIEEQSRILREAFTKVEKKQLQKTTTFLDTLNSTVLDELRHFRQQYDEIWQSTVISLESQREESRREILAISSRLNILADEVVFQKRMSIVQSVLVLLCLGLVIFTHVSGGGTVDYGSMHNRMKFMTGMGMESPIESPPQSPEYVGRDTRRTGRPWLEVDHRRQGSDEMDGSRSRREYESPRTPISPYSDNEEISYTPPSRPDEVFTRTEAELPVLPTGDVDEKDQTDTMSFVPSGEEFEESAIPTPGEIIITAPESPLSSARTPRKQETFTPQQTAPPDSIKEDTPPSEFVSSFTPKPQHIPQLEFPNDPVLRSTSPQHTRSTPNSILVQTPPPRLPSPPAELSLDSYMGGVNDVDTKGIGIAIPMSETNKRHSAFVSSLHDLSPQPTTSLPPVHPYSPEHSETQDANYSSSPTLTKNKRGSFSIARKPLPALPNDS